MICKACVYIHMGTILYKYGWNRSLDNKFMNLYLTVCSRERRTSKYLNEAHLVQKVVYIKQISLLYFRQCIAISTSNYAR